MSNVKAFFQRLGHEAESVAQRLYHTLRATGGEHGHALVEAIARDVAGATGEAGALLAWPKPTPAALLNWVDAHNNASDVVKNVTEALSALDETEQKKLVVAWLSAHDNASDVVKNVDDALSVLGEAAQKELVARLKCRLSGLDPDLPTGHAAASAPTTPGVDGNGAPV